MMRLLPRIPTILLVSATFVAAGCSSKPTPRTEDPGATNLRKIGQAFALFSDMRHRPPRNEEEIRPIFKELGDSTDPDQILRSTRDGEPFVIYYGAKAEAYDPSVIIAHEKTGAEGKRYVLTIAYRVNMMSDADFAGATFPASSIK